MGHETMIVSKGLPIKKFLNKALGSIAHAGHYDKFMKKWNFKNQDCSVVSTNINPLGIKKLSTLFIMIVTGFAFGLIIFLVEILTNGCFHKDTNNIDDDELDALSTDEIKTMFNNFRTKNSSLVRHYINEIRATRE